MILNTSISSTVNLCEPARKIEDSFEFLSQPFGVSYP
jgi:hypothetical protein